MFLTAKGSKLEASAIAVDNRSYTLGSNAWDHSYEPSKYARGPNK